MQPGAGAEVAGHEPPPQEVVFTDLAPAGARPPRGHEVAVVEAGEDAEQQLGREDGAEMVTGAGINTSSDKEDV